MDICISLQKTPEAAQWIQISWRLVLHLNYKVVLKLLIISVENF